MLFAKKQQPQAQQSQVSAGLQFQTSAYGKCLPIAFGACKIAGNLMWYRDFQGVTAITEGGGKGFGGAGGVPGQGSTHYFVNLMLGLCEGPITDIGQVWSNGARQTDSELTPLAVAKLSLFEGTYPQTPWSVATTLHPDEALGYNGIAYVAGGPSHPLGEQASLPNYNFEVYALRYESAVAGQPDADASLVVTDLLTDPVFGALFPVSLLGDLSTYQAYTIASGLWISPSYTDQQTAQSMLSDIVKFTNSEWVFNGSELTIVPYGDQAITANGHTYTPPAAPEYDIGDDDYIFTDDEDPVRLTRKRRADALNSIKLEYLNRDNEYNPDIVEAKNQAEIEQFGLRQEQALSAHIFCDGDAARLSVQLLLQREGICNTYEFTVGQQYIRLDPMDIITITDSRLGLDRQWVRVLEIEEDENLNLRFTVEEYQAGTGAAPNYGYMIGTGTTPNFNESAGNVNAPVIFEPPLELSEGSLVIWVLVSGAEFMGGCEIHTSEDGVTYKLAGTIRNPGRTGELLATLGSVTRATTGPTIDQSNTLQVDLTESRGELTTASTADALNLNTACYVDGEIISYADSDLLDTYQYELSYLVRGAYGSPISTHAPASRFARLDGSQLVIPLTQDRIGQTVFLKFLSYNIYGGALQSLAEVEPYSYTITGSALASPPDDVENFRTAYIAGQLQLIWDFITDPRDIAYEVRKGDSPESAFIIGAAHSTNAMLTQGDGTYWIAARANPSPGLVVYSENWAQIDIEGATLPGNVKASYDEGALGWPGTLDGDVAISGANIVTTATGNILDIVDWLAEPDILNYGGQGGEGTYTIPVGHRINVGRVAPCPVVMNWISIGQTIGADILAVEDYLAITDLLDAQSGANTDVYPEIRVDDGSGYGDWQRFNPGVYVGVEFDGRMRLKSLDAQTQAVLTYFLFEVDVPDLVQEGTNVALGTGVTSVTFPDPFNGGPNQIDGVGTPNIQVTILGATAGDDILLTNQSLTGFDIQIRNGGVGVARNVNWTALGW